jgi:hypothetical protein
MAQLIPLIATASQNLKTTLDQQTVNLSIYQLRYGLYIDVTINNVLEIGAVVCQNLNRIIRSTYLNANVGFSGDFVFNDLQGTTDPVYTGLGTRYQLIYLSASDLAALGFAA